jgi:hypothetical protein
MVFDRRHLLETGYATLSTLPAPQLLSASYANVGKYPTSETDAVVTLHAPIAEFDAGSEARC